MSFILYLWCLVFTFMAFPACAGDEDSRFDQRGKEFFYEQSVSDEVVQIIRDLGIILYKKGRFDQAQERFNMVLTINPQDKIALKYSKLIQKRMETTEESVSAEELPTNTNSAGLSKEEFIRKQVESMVLIHKPIPPPAETVEISQNISFPKIFILDKKTKKSAFTLEIEQNEIIAIKGKTISRFLFTHPDVVSVDQNADVLYITGKNAGKTYLHIWDAQQRWTVEFKIIPLKQKGPDFAEDLRLAEERAKELRVRYSLLSNYSETKNPLSKTLPFIRYRSFKHLIETANPLETPSGDFGFSFSVNSLSEKTEVNCASLSLHNGKIGRFDKFDLQVFDFRPAGTDLAFSKPDLRGVQMASPIFENKLSYRVFWGREIGSGFGGFAPPGLSPEKTHIYFSGLSVDYRTEKEQNYILSAYKGWGKDRSPEQNKYAYDLKALYEFKKLKLVPEIAFDTKTCASTITVNYGRPSLQLITELRYIYRDFQAITGRDYRAGQKGVLVDVHCRPSDKFIFASQIDIFRDGLFPNPDFPDRWNREMSFGSFWAANSFIEAIGDYNYKSNLGKNFPTVTQATGLGLRYKFPTERKINLYLNYNLSRNRYIRTSILDYRNNRITAGSRFSLLNNMHYFLEKEFNWVKALSTNESSIPKVLQTGIEWSGQISDSSFFQTTRFTYRDEDNTNSPFSFLVGEDYIEGYGEVAYSPTPYFNVGLNARVRNIRTETIPAAKRLETEFYLSMNYLWNTHVRLDPVGTVEGYVFKDLNVDGVRQQNEPAIQGVQLWLGKNRTQRTAESGAYKFTKVKAKKTYVTIDTSTIPDGFIVTGPITQEAVILHKGKTVVSFGVSSRTEIHGAVFEDVQGDMKFSRDDKGMQGVALVLSDGTNIFTDSYGVFSKRLPPGKYRMRIDIESIPELYLPMVPVFYDFELLEGQSLNYDVPLRKIQ